MKNTQNNPQTAIFSQKYTKLDVYVKLPESLFSHFNVDLDGYEGLKDFEWGEGICRSYPEDDNFVDYFHIASVSSIETAYVAINQFNEDFGVNLGLDLFKLDAKSVIQL